MNLPDIQNTKINSIKINRVGVSNVDFPIYIKTKDDNKVLCYAKVNIYMSLKNNVRGINMSRCTRSLMRYRYTSFDRWVLWKFLYDLKKKNDSDDVYAEITFKYFTDKVAPISKEKSVLAHECTFIGCIDKNNHYTFRLRVKVTGTSVCPCSFAEDSIIFTDKGPVFIQDLKEGDLVNDQKVLKTYKYKNYKESYTIKGKSFIPLEITKGHKVKVLNKKTNKLEWKKIENLLNSENKYYLLIPIPKWNWTDDEEILIPIKFDTALLQNSSRIESYLRVDKDIAYLLGLYMAEGTCTNDAVSFTFGSKEQSLALKTIKLLLKLGVKRDKIKYHKHSSALIVQVFDRRLSNVFKELFGQYSYQKQIPIAIFNSTSKKIVFSFIRGWYDGDGSHMSHKHDKARHQFISTTSLKAALQLQQIGLRCRNILSIHKRERNNHYILGKIVNVRPIYRVTLNTHFLYELGLINTSPQAHNPNIKTYNNKYFLIPITQVSKTGKVPHVVYDATTENQELCVPFIVHNSKEISKYGAHNQRSVATVTVETKKKRTIWFEDLIKLVENQFSCEVYSVLKRPDEKYVTEKGYENPKFVEDIARDIALSLQKTKLFKWYKIKVENEESIHMHNAVAYICRKLKGSRWVESKLRELR